MERIYSALHSNVQDVDRAARLKLLSPHLTTFDRRPTRGPLIDGSDGWAEKQPSTAPSRTLRGL